MPPVHGIGIKRIPKISVIRFRDEGVIPVRWKSENRAATWSDVPEKSHYIEYICYDYDILYVHDKVVTDWFHESSLALAASRVSPCGCVSITVSLELQTDSQNRPPGSFHLTSQSAQNDLQCLRSWTCQTMTAIRGLVWHWEDCEVCPVGLDETILQSTPFFEIFWGQVDTVYPLVIFWAVQKMCILVGGVKQVTRCPCLFGKLPWGYQYLNRLTAYRFGWFFNLQYEMVWTMDCKTSTNTRNMLSMLSSFYL